MPMPVAHFCMKKYPAKKSPSYRRPVSLCEASTTSAIIDEERIIRMIENVLLTKTSPNIHATLGLPGRPGKNPRSEEHTSELQSLMRSSYAGFCLKKKKEAHEYRGNTHTYKHHYSKTC